MNSVEFISELTRRLNLPKSEVEKRLNVLTGIITSELVKSKAVSLSNLGSLEVKKRNERINVHPETGKRMLIPPKLVVKFKVAPSFNKKMKELSYE
jgi:nucleoid DNA-binding protein